MKRKLKRPPEEAEKIINLGSRFDEIQSDEGQYMALIMLVSGYVVENIKEEYYEDFLKDFGKDVITNLDEFKKFSENQLSFLEPEGNA